MSKLRKFKVDEWVWYDPYHNNSTKALSNFRTRAVILSIGTAVDFFDYRIYIDESSKFKTVREKDLFVIE